MKKQIAPPPFAAVTLRSESATPLYQQLYNELRAAILTGRLKPEACLPPTRALAEELGVSRNTVLGAYEQLLAEGYLHGRVGSGTYVTAALPEELLRVEAKSVARHAAIAPPRERSLSRRGRWLAAAHLPTLLVQLTGASPAFQYGQPAFEEFPISIWSRLQARQMRRPPRELLGYGSPKGYRPLREAIAAHLKTARGVRCEAEQVIIVGGSQQALDLAADVLLDPGDTAWIEDPGYRGARNVLLAAGAKVVPVRVDDEGLTWTAALERRNPARLVFVTPSHQFPLGVTMSLARRLALLDWAKQTGAQSNRWIVEDDYDSEFRYAGRPLAALQGLDQDGRVIYAGTFSKTLFPALRLGCLVVPADLVDVFAAARALTDGHSPLLEQAVLCDFIEQGHFARHLRRMRALYEERQQALVAAARRELAGLLEVDPAPAGMHLIGWLPPRISDRAASEAAARAGIEAAPLSACAMKPLARGGLVLGYTAINARQIEEGVQRLAQALASQLFARR